MHGMKAKEGKGKEMGSDYGKKRNVLRKAN